MASLSPVISLFLEDQLNHVVGNHQFQLTHLILVALNETVTTLPKKN